jgi:SLT domain-containing protein
MLQRYENSGHRRALDMIVVGGDIWQAGQEGGQCRINELLKARTAESPDQTKANQQSELNKKGFPDLNLSEPDGNSNNQKEGSAAAGKDRTLQVQPEDQKKETANLHHARTIDHRVEARKHGRQFRARMVPEQYRNEIIGEALRLSGHRATPAEINYARVLVNQESSFDAGRTNNWDANALAGCPSRGWAQVIGPTFWRYHVPGYADIWNPIDNLAAGIRYADATYGDLDKDRNGLRWVSVHLSSRHLGY